MFGVIWCNFAFFARGVAKVPKHTGVAKKSRSGAAWESIFRKVVLNVVPPARFFGRGEWGILSRILAFFAILMVFGVSSCILAREVSQKCRIALFLERCCEKRQIAGRPERNACFFCASRLAWGRDFLKKYCRTRARRTISASGVPLRFLRVFPRILAFSFDLACFGMRLSGFRRLF